MAKDTSASVLQEKNRSSRRKSQIFREISVEGKNVHDLGPFSTNQKIVLSEDRVFLGTWRLRGQGLDLRGQGRPRGHILKSLALAPKPQVLGLGLEALGPRKLACPRLEDSTIFEPLKFCWKTPESSRKICKYLFCYAQLEHRLSQAAPPPQLKFHQ